MRSHGWGFLLLWSVVSLTGAAQTCPGGVCPLPADVPYEVPFGEPVVLDGLIGSEWDAAVHRVVTLRGEDGQRFPAELFLKHDTEFLYIAVRLEALPRPASTSVSVVSIGFDNGDGVLWDVGDDLLLLPERDGQVVTKGGDHHFLGYGQRALDDAQNAQGVGRWLGAVRAYEFEVRRELYSEDPFDLPIVPEAPVTLRVGFERLDRWGATVYTAHGAAFLIVVSV